MGTVIFQALFFFLPAYVSNAMPVLLARFKLFEFLAIPVDFGLKIGKFEVFGKTKTFRGIIGGIAGAMVVVFLQSLFFGFWGNVGNLFLFSFDVPSVFILGFYLGFGEGLGDLFKSFIKRRLNIHSSAPFFPFDQMSFFGALFLSSFYFVLPIEHTIAIVVISPLLPLIANIFAFRIGWKKVWW
jgi:CDP-2,3-bis-(O-geranylgeranyl)-sn-glycerol synthase